jgi:hypothetical protein
MFLPGELDIKEFILIKNNLQKPLVGEGAVEDKRSATLVHAERQIKITDNPCLSTSFILVLPRLIWKSISVNRPTVLSSNVWKNSRVIIGTEKAVVPLEVVAALHQEANTEVGKEDYEIADDGCHRQPPSAPRLDVVGVHGASVVEPDDE